MKVFCFFMISVVLFTCPLADAVVQTQPQNASESEHSPSGTRETDVVGNPSDLSKKNILLLHAYSCETATYQIMDPIFVKGLVEAGLRRFNLHFEFMDLAKYPNAAHRREFSKYLSSKSEQHSIDLIIALHSPAFDFLVEEGRNLFPEVPVINVIGASEFLQDEDLMSSYERRVRPSNRPFVMLPYSTDVDSTVKNILSLRPDTLKQVAFDIGNTEKTIKVHRARVMEKMGAESLADLVRMAEKLDLLQGSQVTNGKVKP